MRLKRGISILLLVVFFFFISFSSVYAATFEYGDDYDHDVYLEQCNFEAIKADYNGSCWCCSLVETLMRYLTSSAAQLAQYTQQLGLMVLLYGIAIWIAAYLLKSLSAFAAQDPSKVLDGLFSFMFKWAIIYLLVASGIDAMVGNVINPLLSIGLDIGHTFV
jgi:hypothetical protein